MRCGWLTAGVAIAALTMFPPAATGQDASGEELISLFFDCQAPGCRDLDYMRREVPFVNWVLDREVADVHVLVTSQETGSGGRMYTLAFIGLADFEGDEHELTISTPGDATADEQRSALAQRIRLGLVRYAQNTPVADRLQVTFDDASAAGRGGPGEAPGATSPEEDPWNFWVFTLRGNAFLNGEATSKFTNYFGEVEANRTTELWKFGIESSFSEDVQQFQIPDGAGGYEVVEETRSDWNVGGLAVRSLGGKWALGTRADVGSSTYVNQDFRWSVRPGLEYNFFPYAESSRRSMTLQYLLGPTHFEYTDTTIYGETEETRAQQSLTARLSLVEPWGRWSTSVSGQQYLHDTSKYSVSISGNINVRLFRGFSIRLGGNYSWIRDQLFVAARGATDEEILLRQRQLETSYRYFTSFGIEYRFGSIFNNVVNPRFGDSGGGGFFFF
jgi:hypothetical protein